MVEPPVTPGGPKQMTRPTSGTPQGGVISPLLANLYLHWFDKVFHAPGGPAQWAKAKLVRYADDFVVLARHQSAAAAHLHRDEAGRPGWGWRSTGRKPEWFI